MTMITPSYLGETIEYSSLHACRSTLEDPITSEGVGALSLRAIAREMGMASSAIYRYYPSRDDLVNELCAEGYASIAAALALTRDACPADDHPRRWRALCHAYRQWALEHPSDFTLIFGAPLPGYHAPEEITGPPSSEFIAVPFGVYASAVAASAANPDRTLVDAAVDVGDLMRGLAPGYPPRLALIVLNGWASIHGYVALESFGSLTSLARDTDGLFESHVSTVMLGMGFG